MVSTKIQLNLIKFYLALFLRVFYLLTPVILLFYQENGLSYKHLFLFQGIFYLTAIIVEFPIAYISDTYSRKHLLMSSIGIFMAVTVFWFLWHGFWVILLGEVLFAISKVMLDNSTSGYLYDYLVKENLKEYMPKYLGYVQFSMSLSLVAVALIGTTIYMKYGSSIVLICQFCIMLLGMFLINSLPDIRSRVEKYVSQKESIQKFSAMTLSIYKNPAIKYYIYYAGLVSSFSILFAISFQPLMQKSLFPIFMFGVITFFNHGIRAISGAIAGKVQNVVKIRDMIIPLYLLYILAFSLIFLINDLKSIPIITILIFMICLIIGYQLLFSIMHISRLHKFVDIENRGNLMAINDTIGRGMSAVILISSKLLMDKMDLSHFYYWAFLIFIIPFTYFMIKTYKIKDVI